jgi:prevent-host-death family protein
MRVSSAEFLKKFGTLTDKALSEPLTITRNGRDRLVVLSVEEYDRLKRRDRRVYAIEEMTPEQIAALEKAEVPAEYAYLDAELRRCVCVCSHACG